MRLPLALCLPRDGSCYVLAFVLLSSVLAGCGCDQQGCMDLVRITLHGPNGQPLVAGSYVITLTADGVEHVVACDLDSSRASCTETAQVGSFSPRAPAELELELRGAPRLIHLLIERDGSVVLDQSMSPTYSEVAVNQPGCGPVCAQYFTSVNTER